MGAPLERVTRGVLRKAREGAPLCERKMVKALDKGVTPSPWRVMKRCQIGSPITDKGDLKGVTPCVLTGLKVTRDGSPLNL